MKYCNTALQGMWANNRSTAQDELYSCAAVNGSAVVFMLMHYMVIFCSMFLCQIHRWCTNLYGDRIHIPQIFVYVNFHPSSGWRYVFLSYFPIINNARVQANLGTRASHLTSQEENNMAFWVNFGRSSVQQYSINYLVCRLRYITHKAPVVLLFTSLAYSSLPRPSKYFEFILFLWLVCGLQHVLGQILNILLSSHVFCAFYEQISLTSSIKLKLFLMYYIVEHDFARVYVVFISNKTDLHSRCLSIPR